MNATIRRRFYRVLSIVLGAIALPLAFNEQGLSPQHPPWLTLVLLLACLAGLCASVVAVYRIDRREDDHLHRSTREALGTGSVRGIAHHPRTTLWWLTGASAATALLAWVAWGPGHYGASAMLGALAALLAGSAFVLRRINRAELELRIDAAGIHCPDFGLIVWHDVVGLRRYRDDRFEVPREGLQVCLSAPGRYLARLPAWQQDLLSFDGASARRYAPVLLFLDRYRMPVDTAYTTALSLRRRVPAPFVDDWEPQMDDAEVAEYLLARAPALASTHQANAPAFTPALIDANGDATAAAPDFARRLQAQQEAAALATVSQRRQQVRQRTRQRRWHEGALGRGLLATAIVTAYVLAKAFSEGLIG